MQNMQTTQDTTFYQYESIKKASLVLGLLALIILTRDPSRALGFETQKVAWHRGDVSAGQENSRTAIEAALNSASPHLEVDVLDFKNNKGERVGLLAHDYRMDRLTGKKGKFATKNQVQTLPHNIADQSLQPEAFITVIDLFELIKETKKGGTTPWVSLDMKEKGKQGRDFGVWLGQMIKDYGFEDHVFASSFYKSNIKGIKDSCPECLTGGLVFKEHFALKHLDYRYTSLDLPAYSKVTFFLGFLGKKQQPHDFVLIQDDILFSNPELIKYWREVRNVKFVGAFVYDKERTYSDEEFHILSAVDWIELDPPQMQQWLQRKTITQ